MDWDALIDLLRRHIKKTIAGVLVIFMAGLSVGGYLLYAEQCHAQAQENKQVIKDMLEWQRQERNRQEMELKLKEQARLKVVELCLRGLLKDKDECAKAGAPLDQ
jgi:hypothetical protein